MRGSFGFADLTFERLTGGVFYAGGRLGSFKVLEVGGYGGRGAVFFEGGETVRDEGDAGGAGFACLERQSVVVVDVVVGGEDVTLEGGQMLDGRVGHEGGADVGGHHHDGRAGVAAAHLPFGGHGPVLAVAHDVERSEAVYVMVLATLAYCCCCYGAAKRGCGLLMLQYCCR